MFAIEHFHHFAYMAIGVAMLGFGASGTLVALVGPRDPARAARWLERVTAAAPIALVAGPAVAQLVNLDATRLAWDGSQWARLAMVYIALALPFTVGSGAILLALGASAARPGRLYGASFAGAGLGAGAAIAALWILPPVRALAFPALLGALGAIALRRRATTWAGLGVAALAFARPPWRLEIAPYKGQPQVEAYPDARRVSEHSSPLGWVVAVRAPAFRHAPGLSLAYHGSFPAQTALFVDGDLAGAATDGDTAAAAFFGWLPAALPYALGAPGRVLVIGGGGGMDVSVALAHGAPDVVAVELQPALALLAGATAGDRVTWVVGDARGYLARAVDPFDLIVLGPPSAPGGMAAGVYSLSEDFVHTADAYATYLARLSPRGLLAVTRWLDVPPRGATRAVLTAAEALRRQGRAVDRGIVVAKSWATVTVLVKADGFTPDDVAALRSWAAERRFDIDWHPGIAAPTPGFNALDDPALFHAAAAAAAGPDVARRFADAYPFDVAPAGDDRPYPHHFLRLGALGRFLALARGTWLPFAEWGLVALLATLVQSVVVAGACLVLPVAVAARRSPGASLARLIGYFASVGVAYMAAEVGAIQQLALLLGHPVYAVAAVLAGLLVCSGVGSAWSDRLPAARCAERSMWLAGSLALYGAALLPLAHLLQGTGLGVRAAAAIVVLAPLGVLMGMPFPLGLRAVARAGTPGVAWAWAANGFASVVGAPLAALVALEAGTRALFLLAAVAYLTAALLARRVDTSSQPALIER